MAQPIQGIRGDRYHEVLVRMEGESGELTGPNEFLPVAHEFGPLDRLRHQDKMVMFQRFENAVHHHDFIFQILLNMARAAAL